MARIEDIDNTLGSMQECVGGWIECVYPPQLAEIDDSLVLVCNEEGKLDGLKPSRALYDAEGKLYDVIAGTCFIAYDDGEGGFTDIPDDVVDRIMELFDWKYSGKVMKLGGAYCWVSGYADDEEEELADEED